VPYPGVDVAAAGAVGGAEPLGGSTASTGAGSPGPVGAGAGADAGRSTTVAPTKAAITTTTPATAPSSAIPRREAGRSSLSLRRSAAQSIPSPNVDPVRGRCRGAKGYHVPPTAT
jgi:hypothetical protein